MVEKFVNAFFRRLFFQTLFPKFCQMTFFVQCLNVLSTAKCFYQVLIFLSNFEMFLWNVNVLSNAEVLCQTSKCFLKCGIFLSTAKVLFKVKVFCQVSNFCQIFEKKSNVDVYCQLPKFFLSNLEFFVRVSTK